MPQNTPPRILVTRSEPGASETMAKLRAAGFDPIVEPLFTIAPINAAIPDFDALALTSANGARHFARLSPRRDAPVFCVGERTAQAARETGFADVVSADGDVAALAELIGRRLTRGARLLHAGNEGARGDLAGQLEAHCHADCFVAIFRAVSVERPGPCLTAQLAGETKLDAIMLHSPRAGDILAEFAARYRHPPLPVVAISNATAASLTGVAARIEIAATPDEAALISALARLVFG